ncbi:MAG: riboflavin kinase, partial [Clostridia bacterium]|nr:riboflavin kinase [Clostridia bacterium]
RNYSVTGKVFKDREVGSTIGFPTANIKLESDKFCIKDGVYAGITEIDGKVYKAIINYGARPTFNLKDKLIEAHIDGFDGNLYGREITLEFTSRIRDVKKFNGEEDLKAQLEKDLKGLKDGIYD